MSPSPLVELDFDNVSFLAVAAETVMYTCPIFVDAAVPSHAETVNAARAVPEVFVAGVHVRVSPELNKVDPATTLVPLFCNVPLVILSIRNEIASPSISESMASFASVV